MPAREPAVAMVTTAKLEYEEFKGRDYISNRMTCPWEYLQSCSCYSVDYVCSGVKILCLPHTRELRDVTMVGRYVVPDFTSFEFITGHARIRFFPVPGAHAPVGPLYRKHNGQIIVFNILFFLFFLFWPRCMPY